MTRRRTPEKPKLGQPCNGCGVCCIATPCPVSRAVLGQEVGPCRALTFEDGRFWCDLVRGNGHQYIEGLSEKPWAGEALAVVLMRTGGWIGLCDSDD